MSSISQHVIILGGSSGIGLATAGLLLGEGYSVTIAGRDAARLDAARQALPAAVEAIALDASDPAVLAEAFARIGTFDHLVLALGSRKGLAPLADLDLADVRGGFEEKVFPHLAAAKAAVPHLSPTGSITFIAAVSAHAAMPGIAGIAAANAAITAMVPVLALELAPRRVNAVSPGVIDTPWWDFMPTDQRRATFEDFARRTPLGRNGRPEDVAGAIAFLIGNDFTTAHTLICDGGARLVAAG